MGSMDWSTINLPLLHRLPVWKSSGTNWSVSDHPGMGCFGDPPGYPSYFLRPVYIGGNRSSHRNGAPEVVITEGGEHRVVMSVGQHHESLATLTRKLWIPLPYGHERVKLWIRATYRHLRHCYRDDAGIVAEKNDNGMIVYPVPYYKLRVFQDDPRFSEAWRHAERRAVDTFNADVRERSARVATPDNHCAVRVIRKFYPEHAADLDLISDVTVDHEGDWWETEAARPGIGDCRPRNGIGATDHAIQWCQWCGRQAGEE
jgi:hypothetical protein